LSHLVYDQNNFRTRLPGRHRTAAATNFLIFAAVDGKKTADLMRGYWQLYFVAQWMYAVGSTQSSAMPRVMPRRFCQSVTNYCFFTCAAAQKKK
jgi:hypothetical protein